MSYQGIKKVLKLFTSHILDKRIPIDVGVLCDFMDHLCGSLLIASRLRTTATLHDLTLTKSWLAHLTPSIEALRTKDTQLVAIYGVEMLHLLEPIYTGLNAGTSDLEIMAKSTY